MYEPRITVMENLYLVKHRADFIKDTAKALNRSCSWVTTAYRFLGLRLSDKDRKKSQFQVGHIPLNKGKKMDPEVYEKCKGTMFKKGQVCKTRLEIGTITIRIGHPHRNSPAYKWIKIAEPNIWIIYHVHIWEQKYGQVPKGHLIVFKNKNTMETELNNLMCITRSEHGKRNIDYVKAAATNKKNWESGLQYESDIYIGKLVIGTHNHKVSDKEVVEKLKNPKFRSLVKLKRTQLLLKRGIKHAKQSNRNRTKVK